MKAILSAAVLFFMAASISAALSANPTSSVLAGMTIQPVKINLNQADIKTLIHSMKGIGPKRAEAIVRYREEHGMFKSIEDLARVRGIGRTFVKHHLAQLQEIFSVE
ncbi:ComEA family DNA-binding protein [Legionella nagasakiensis]|uniref:ComEA family DNA-binding protein n=1 Tax=Legionella nagasakiensis TaxID=535290 RepID=UPI0010564293|nr:helix-hairpin-helix domain-containing protein [Legionella nagasakiensis]